MITAVIPVHNRADLLRHLLATLHAQTLRVAEIIVVDNGSVDGAADVARLAGCRVIALDRNSGFAHAANVGWRAAATPWVAVLNSDVELDPLWLQNLIANSGAAGFATGLILDFHERTVVDGTYDLVTRAACAWRAGTGESRRETMADPQPIAIAPGTACLFRTEVLRALDGFDERYGSYLEDVDLGLRCLRMGITGVYVPHAVAWHHGSATLGRWNPAVVRLISRNQVLLVSRHYDRALFRACFWPIVAGQLLWGMVALRHGAAFAWAAGKWEGIRGFRLEGEPNELVSQFFTASEKEIRARAKGAYWRWYFLLTSPVLFTSPDAAPDAAH